jgi:hypothetical protein
MVRFEVLTVTSLKVTAFWELTVAIITLTMETSVDIYQTT